MHAQRVKSSFPGRSDILSRHQNSHLASEVRKDATAGFRACTRCAADRIRCLGGNPCQRCLKKATGCTYPAHRKRKATSKEHGRNRDSRDFNTRANQTTGVPEGSLDHRSVVNSTASQEVMHTPQTDNQTSHSSIKQTSATDPAIPKPQWDPNRTNRTCRTDGFEETQRPIVDQRGFMNHYYDPIYEQGFNGQGFSSINWGSPNHEVYEDWNTQFTSFVWPTGIEASISLAADNATLLQRPLNASDTGIAVSAVSPGVSLNSPSHSSNSTSSQATAVPGANVRGYTSSEATSRYYVDNTGARDSVQQLRKKRKLASRRLEDDHSPPQIILGPNQSLPTTAQADLEEQTGASNCWVPVDLYNELLRNIRKSGQSMASLASFPSLKHLNMFCQLYFDAFHPGFPFIRKLSFGAGKDDWLLALAVATTGARYSNTNTPDTVTFKRVLHTSLRTILERDTNNTDKGSGYVYATKPYRTFPMGNHMVYIQIRILNVLLMIHSGDETLMSTAYSEFSALVAVCNRMHLLSPIDMKDLAFDQPNEQARESEWLQIQLKIRAGYMIWLLDYTFMYEFNQPPQMELADAQAPLPCSQEAWEGRIPWNISTQSEAASLVTAVDALYREKRLIPNVSEFGRVILVHAICRQTTEVYTYSRNRMSTWLPSVSIQPEVEFVPTEIWPPSSPTVSKWRNSACDGLDILHWSANSKVAQSAGLEHPTILHLHLARLIILTPIVHIQDLADLDESDFEMHPSNAIYTFAPSKTKTARQVLQWAICDQYKARLSLIHAAAIFWHIRRYSCNNFIEPFAVYISTLVIWAYSVSTQLSKRQEQYRSIITASQRNGTDTTTYDTSNPPETPRSSAALSDEDSDPDPSFIHLDRPCDDESVQMYMRLGHKVTANISRVGDVCADGAPKRILLEGIRLLSDGNDLSSAETSEMDPVDRGGFACTWGITLSYVHSLQRLVRAIEATEQCVE
ncbi:hypothetical protein V492_03862 [Pseudogymnoascus sp. VKM F-4246]|nr:hypothetical protein V492_03862 [Pseudogymnoascus sp. VKM F-4246]